MIAIALAILAVAFAIDVHGRRSRAVNDAEFVITGELWAWCALACVIGSLIAAAHGA